MPGRNVTIVELWRRGQAGWPRRFPLFQLPNAPLLVAFAGRGLAAATPGRARGAGRAAYALGLGVWAWQELTGGANWVRRLMGAGALAMLLARQAASETEPPR